MSSDQEFQALVVDRGEQGVVAGLRTLPRAALPPGDVTIAVAYSSLNYTDALALTGRNKVVRRYPMVPGIDLAGRVVESGRPGVTPGDAVLVTGWGLGERHWGGYARLARVPAEWVTPLPAGLTPQQAMAIGTAGVTAMLSVLALEERGLTPAGAGEREIAVTGAAGGVGGIAVAILSRLGYNVTAVSGRADAAAYLRELGARQVIGRDALPLDGRPLEHERWAGAVDVVGGRLLAALLRGMAHDSSVAVCGLAGGAELPTTVLPFILRSVSLLGINSVLVPPARRVVIWARLVRDLPLDRLDRMTRVVPLGEVTALAETMLAGQVRGRVVVAVEAD